MHMINSANSLKRPASRSEQINTLESVGLNSLLKKHKEERHHRYTDKIHKEIKSQAPNTPQLPDWKESFKLILNRLHKITKIGGNHLLWTAIIYIFLRNANTSINALKIGKLHFRQTIVFIGESLVLLWYLLKKSNSFKKRVSTFFLISAYIYYLQQTLYHLVQ